MSTTKAPFGMRTPTLPTAIGFTYSRLRQSDPGGAGLFIAPSRHSVPNSAIGISSGIRCNAGPLTTDNGLRSRPPDHPVPSGQLRNPLSSLGLRTPLREHRLRDGLRHPSNRSANPNTGVQHRARPAREHWLWSFRPGQRIAPSDRRAAHFVPHSARQVRCVIPAETSSQWWPTRSRLHQNAWHHGATIARRRCSAHPHFDNLSIESIDG